MTPESILGRDPVTSQPITSTPAKVGACLFIFWGITHIAMGLEGPVLSLYQGEWAPWNLTIGKNQLPPAGYMRAICAINALAQSQMILMGGYGVLSLFVAWLILTRASWFAYFIGVFVLGISDIAFLFAMARSGFVELTMRTFIGPVNLLLAILITPFGMPRAAKQTIWYASTLFADTHPQINRQTGWRKSVREHVTTIPVDLDGKVGGSWDL